MLAASMGNDDAYRLLELHGHDQKWGAFVEADRLEEMAFIGVMAGGRGS